MSMQRIAIIGIGAFAAYWFLIRGRQTVVAIAAPAQTTGAPQPQGVQGGWEPIANTYDLNAYPMGTFITRR